MNDKLIMDVGMLNGEDTRFYLDKGYSVVGVEADPTLVDENSLRFAKTIAEKRLTIIPKAVATYTGEITFYVNSGAREWGTLSERLRERNERRGFPNEPVDVACIKFEEVLKEHGIPYYLKVDIEGADMLCLRALSSFNERPKYVSIEIDDSAYDLAVEPLLLLEKLGYRQFKLVDQSLHYKLRCPNPALEGNYVDATFSTANTGPFGEETPGKWRSKKQIERQLKRFIQEQRIALPEGDLYNKRILRWPYRVWRRTLGYRTASWYDLHAKMGAGE